MLKKIKTEISLTASFLLVLLAFSASSFYIGSTLSVAGDISLSDLILSGNAAYKFGIMLFMAGSMTALIVLVLSIFKSVSFLEKKAREADRAKNEFISLASHQLRTPLSTVNWYVELLLSEEAGKTNELQKKYLDEIYNGNQRMIELVNALLYVDLGAFVVDKKPSNLTDIADGVLNEFSPQIKRRRIKIVRQYEKKMTLIETDPNLLWIVMQNFISNSIKYSPEGGRVTISVKQGIAEAIISVSDNGYGIPQDQQKRIFKRLFRAENIVQKSEGTGLGLYLVKAIAKQVKGRVWFQSVENEGTTFYFAVPWTNKKKRYR